MWGYDFAGLILAYKSSILRNTTITSRAHSPTGALRQASDFLILSTVSSGNAFPVSLRAVSPAAHSVISNFSPSLSLMVLRTDTADSDTSGPIPSPVINDILYMIHFHFREF